MCRTVFLILSGEDSRFRSNWTLKSLGYFFWFDLEILYPRSTRWLNIDVILTDSVFFFELPKPFTYAVINRILFINLKYSTECFCNIIAFFTLIKLIKFHTSFFTCYVTPSYIIHKKLCYPKHYVFIYWVHKCFIYIYDCVLHIISDILEVISPETGQTFTSTQFLP